MKPFTTPSIQMRRHILILTIALLTMVSIIALPRGTARSQEDTPNFPTVLTGTAILDGATAPDGTVLKATIGGNVVATTTLTGGRYTLTVPPHPSTDYTGMTITFTINNIEAAQTTQWHSDGGGNLDLRARTPLPPSLKRSIIGVTNVLVDQYGLSLYTLAQDGQENSPTQAHISCEPPECQGSWQPFTIAATDTITTTGVPNHLATKVTLPNSRAQIAYNGWPLYRFTGDQAPGQANGQGLDNTWWLISPNAQIIQGPGSPGQTGLPGKDGKDGTNGKNGKDGLNGPPGETGKDGRPGHNGINGIDGTNGRDGIDGQNGKDAPSGPQGEPGPQGPPGPPGPPGSQQPPTDAPPPTKAGPLEIIATIIAILALLAAGYAIYLNKGLTFLPFVKPR